MVLTSHSPALDVAVAQSVLAKVAPEIRARVFEGGYCVEVPAGALLAQTARTPAVGLVMEGLIRCFLESTAGRQVTIRYVRPGEILGLVHLFGGFTEAQAQAVTPVSLWVIAPVRLRSLCEENGPLATALAEDCALRAVDAIEELTLVTFGSVRQRVARHLLDLAAAQQQAGELVAAVTQQQLADAAGSVREVVARVLKDFHQAGLTAGSDGGVIILDAAALDAEVTGGVKAT